MDLCNTNISSGKIDYQRSIPVLRISRQTSNIKAISLMYMLGLNLELLDFIHNRHLVCNIILGHHNYPYHLEFVQNGSEGKANNMPNNIDSEDTLIFYIKDNHEWQIRCDNMLYAGFISCKSIHSYYSSQTRTFQDLDGRYVILYNKSCY